jgi:hypothetical protein
MTTTQMQSLCKQFDGSNWQLVGSAGFSGSASSIISMDFNPHTNQPFVSYNLVVGGSTWVSYFNNSEWVSLGSPQAVDSTYGCSKIAINPTTYEPYVICKNKPSFKATVLRYTGSLWESIGAAEFSNGMVTSPTFAFNPLTDEPYAAFRDENSKMTVMKFATDHIETPTASPSAGVYSTPQTVTLSTTTDGADIYYNINDSSPPDEKSLHYTEPILISTDTTLKAIAVKDGMIDSDVATLGYTISISPETYPVYRFWSDKNQGHFYTMSEDEKNYVIAHYPTSTWLYEQIAWNAFG